MHRVWKMLQQYEMVHFVKSCHRTLHSYRHFMSGLFWSSLHFSPCVCSDVVRGVKILIDRVPASLFLGPFSFLNVCGSDRSGLFDAVEAEAWRWGGNRHRSCNSCADGMVVLPAVPMFPNHRADLNISTQHTCTLQHRWLVFVKMSKVKHLQHGF